MPLTSRLPKLILLISEIWTMTDPRDLRKVVRYAMEAEEAGFDAVMIGEHVVMGPKSAYRGQPANPRDWLMAGNQPPMFPHPNGLHQLSAISSVTSRIKLLAAAVLTPLRHPLTLAKEFATVDLLSEGRLIVLPGVSWQQEEYAALNVDFTQRGAILDEQLEIWSHLWRKGSPITHEGKHFRFQDIFVEPQPFKPTGVTLWTGGLTLIPPILARLVRYSTGLFLLHPPEKEELDQIEAAMTAAGRDLAKLDLAALVSAEFTDATSVLDLGAALAPTEALRERGFNSFVIKPSQFIDEGVHLGAFCREVVRRMGA
jgi:alkanesulfonate monooxygenase SsuD/methylene tetrahydromethanopterin reductase-like flavin-dependent oxidoreductase (luciferase family)